MTEPYYQDDYATVLHGDSLDLLKQLPDASVHAVVTDPPYGYGNTQRGKVLDTIRQWLAGEDAAVPAKSGDRGMYRRRGRTATPKGSTSNGGSMHWARPGADAPAEDWDRFVPPPALWDEVYRVLKPGGHILVFSATKTIDLMTLSIRMAGFDIRDQIAWIRAEGMPKTYELSKTVTAIQRGYTPEASGISKMAKADGGKVQLTEDGKKWHGWASALKPAVEPIILAKKPHAGSVAANVLEHDTGALNIDATRYGGPSPTVKRREARRRQEVVGGRTARDVEDWLFSPMGEANHKPSEELGRFPMNALLDEASHSELPAHVQPTFPVFKFAAKAPRSERPILEDGTTHPTVKPLSLMRWLVRLVTPLDGVVLDPFAGSGTTLEAAKIEGFKSIGCEITPEYLPLILQRMERAVVDPHVPKPQPADPAPELAEEEDEQPQVVEPSLLDLLDDTAA